MTPGRFKTSYRRRFVVSRVWQKLLEFLKQNKHPAKLIEESTDTVIVKRPCRPIIIFWGLAGLGVLNGQESSLNAPPTIPSVASKLEATPGSSKWTQHQVEVILEHCPQLQSVVQPGNVILTWLTMVFDASRSGNTIVFDTQLVSVGPTSAECGCEAGHSDLYYVRVNPKYSDGPRAGQERTAEEILCNLVFELNNVRLLHDREAIEHLAQCGEIRREAYVYDCAQEEYFALRKTAGFYETIWVPFCAKCNTRPNPRVWLLPMDTTVDEWLAKHPKDSWYPWKLFGGRYDQLNWGLSHPVVLRALSAEEMQTLMKKAAAGEARSQERVGIAFLSREMGSSTTGDQQAFDWILKAADQGDILAEKHLEWMYWLGIGTEKDQAKSFAWNMKTANQGDAQAEYLLGAHYAEGVGVHKNLVEAMRWYQKSADQGYGEAEDSVGYALLKGEGIEKNPQNGLVYLMKAAHGNAHASYTLASCYAQGFFVKQDLTEAYKWCLISLSIDWQASALSQQLKKQLSDAQIKQAESEAAM
jgi:hypothetical protein